MYTRISINILSSLLYSNSLLTNAIYSWRSQSLAYGGRRQKVEGSTPAIHRYTKACPHLGQTTPI